jgi:hypothetical protein|tara:strand:- start:1444 stop:1818 length:375 start_codon:yes stop_codon:yes gene_type:complete
VEPPDYDDGLLVNIPAIINEDDYFSLSLNADLYTQNQNWELDFTSTGEDTLYTSLVIKDFSSSISDSSFLILYNSNNAEIFNIHINGETTSISEIAIEYIGNPSRIELVSKKLNCLLDLQLIRQ